MVFFPGKDAARVPPTGKRLRNFLCCAGNGLQLPLQGKEASCIGWTVPRAGVEHVSSPVARRRGWRLAQPPAPAMAWPPCDSPEAPPGRRRRPARPAKGKAKNAAVETVEIRPASRVVSRRNQARREPVQHLPHHPVVPFTPPAWMLEECQISPARAGEQSRNPPTARRAADAPRRGPSFMRRSIIPITTRPTGWWPGSAVGSSAMPRSCHGRSWSAPPRFRRRWSTAWRCCRSAAAPGHGQRLVKAAEERMRQIGAVVAFSRTRIAASFHELGWSVLGRDCATPGRPTEIVARLARGVGPPRRAGDDAAMAACRTAGDPADLPPECQPVRGAVGSG